MFCDSCGKQIHDDAKFCPNCGAPNRRPEEDVTPAPIPETPSTTSVEAEPLQPSADAPKKKKRSKLPILLLAAAAAVILLVLIFSGGKPAKPNEDQLRSDLLTYLALDFQEKLVEFEIIEEITVEEEPVIAYLCDVVIEDGKVHCEESYGLEYHLSSENEWLCAGIEGLDPEEWITRPMNGITQEQLRQSLKGREIELREDRYAVLEADELNSMEIDTQETDLELGVDDVSVFLTTKDSILQWNFRLDLQYVFDGEWYLHRMELGAVSNTILPEKAFDRTEADYLAAIYATPIGIPGDYGTQHIAVTEDTMKNFQYSDAMFSYDDYTHTVNCSFDLVKPLATLHVDARLIFVCQSSGWAVESIAYTPAVETVSVAGSWVGTYDGVGRDKPTLTVQIDNQDANNMLTGTVSFAPSAEAPDYPTGSHSFVGGIDKEELTFTIRGDQWVEKPESRGGNMLSWYMVNEGATLLIDENCIVNDDGLYLTIKQ